MPYDETTIFIRAEFDDMLGNYCIAMHLFNSGVELAVARERNIWFSKKNASKIQFIKKDKKFEGWNERHGH